MDQVLRMGDRDAGRDVFEFGVLGPITASRGGDQLSLGSPQQRAILAVLVCHAGRIVTHERLVDALWGDAPSAAVVSSIRAAVSHLRQVLEPDRVVGEAYRVLVTESSGYRLAVPETAVDARRFERLVARARSGLEAGDPGAALSSFDAALSLWRGDVLVDLRRYPFVDVVAPRLEELRIAGEEGRIGAHLDLGHDSAALTGADRLLEEHPLREGLAAHRMVALYRVGRQSDALATYRDLRARLDAELGIEPNRTLQLLQQRILRQDPTLQSEQRVTEPVAAPPEPASPAMDEPSASPAGSARTRPRRLIGSRRPLPVRRLLLALVACGLLSLALAGSRPPPEPARNVSANSVGVVDSDGHLVGQVGVGTSPTALSSGGGAVWVVNQSDDTVMRIDPVTLTVTQRFVVGDNPAAVVVTDEDVWVANFGDATVTRINIAGNRITQAAIPVGGRPTALTEGAGGVWVANSADNTVQRIDAKTGVPGAAVDVGEGPDGLLVADDVLWVANGRDGTLSRLGLLSGVVAAAPVPVGSGPRGLALAAGDVWVADELSQSVTRLNVSTYRTRPVSVADGPTAVAELGGAIWVASQYDGSLTRIDPETEQQTTTIPLGGSPLALAALGGRLWVSVGAAGGAEHRGGILTVASSRLPGAGLDGIDPAVAYGAETIWAERLVYEGLVALRYFGEDSQTLVPNLATAIPLPSDGGRAYTFQLRPGLRYSTGQAVKASDFRRGMARALTQGGGPLFVGVVGAPACRRAPEACDLSRGVEVDDNTRRVTIHLSAPDPDFLYKLTLFVMPTPNGSDRAAYGVPPGTGPYVISRYARDEVFELARNPYFTQSWSVPAAPEGYPDLIRWLKVADAASGVAAVDAGQADLAALKKAGDPTRAKPLLTDLSVRRPAQVHIGPAVGTVFAGLNATHPPFDSATARQAVNFAVDRARIVDLLGGPLAAEPICQLTIPGFPGYRRYCPYTSAPVDGDWRGPDLATARRLVAESGTAGAHVTVADLVGDINPPLEAYLAEVLRELGYVVDVQELPLTDENRSAFYDPGSPFEVVAAGWLSDYPRPSTFYDPLLRCATPERPQQYPLGHCDAATDEAADAALALQTSDPGQSLRAWAAVQRTVVDQAPVVFGATMRDVWYTGTRVGNYQQAALYGPLLSQIWVQ